MTLEEKIQARRARVGVVGLGYVGLPLAVEFARRGFTVTGFDVVRSRAAAIRSGRSYIPDVPADAVARLRKDRTLDATSDFEALKKQDAVILCVPTPLRKTRDPDVAYILEAAKSVAEHLRPGQLIVLESTTYPGTTREVVLPLLEEGKLREGKDFFLAFSPERVDPGNKEWRIPNTPKVVGGMSPKAAKLAKALYAAIVREVVVVSSTEAAEMVKLLENTFRAVNIGLINEIATMCERLGLDVWEVVDAAKSKPFGFMPFYPGPGIGGHCIPVDPQYLAWKMKALNFEPRFIDLATVVNGSMPRYVAARIARLLNQRGKPVKGSKVLALGVAYKPGVSDTRESPAIDVIGLLEQEGARVSFHDPYVSKLVVDRRTYRNSPLTDAAVRGADCVVILTAHPGLDYASIVRKSKLVFDARNATRGLRGSNLRRL